MALATARLTFSFRHSTPRSVLPSPKPPRTHFAVPLPVPKASIGASFHKSLSARFSVDISKEDKPVADPEPTEAPAEEEEESEEETAFDKRRLEEKFAVLNIGVSECRSCGYQYDQATGDPSYPIPPGLEFGKLPDDWRCPTCGAAKSFFVSKSVEIAGFAQNQQFGLGANTLTSGQKALLIYGSLLLFFALFLSGYFLQ